MRSLLLLCAALPLAAEDQYALEAYLFGASYHVNRTADWNEVNPGLALGIADTLDEHVDVRLVGGAYRDSYSQTATFLMLGGDYVIGDRRAMHGTIGLQVGYYRGSGNRDLGLAPVVSLGYDRIDVCLTGSPSTGDTTVDGNHYPSTAALAVFLKLRFLDF